MQQAQKLKLTSSKWRLQVKVCRDNEAARHDERGTEQLALGTAGNLSFLEVLELALYIATGYISFLALRQFISTSKSQADKGKI